MKTFAIYPVKDINIEGTDYTPSDQVGVVTCDVRLATLLGLIQFGHATAEEIDASELMEVEPEAQPEAVDDSSVNVLDESESDSDDDDTIDYEPSEVEEPSVSSFVSDGLDEKISAALIAQGVNTPDELRKLIADGYDLTELDDIGKVRAENILKIYG